MADSVAYGVDFSPGIERAIPWVRRFIAPGSRSVLVHAVDRPPIAGFLRKAIPLAIAATDVMPQIRVRLDALAERAGVADACRVTRGGRADQVLRDVAREKQASLLVIGAHGVPTRAWKRVGSTAERVLRAAEHSLLVVRGELAAAPRTILVAVDDVAITPRVLSVAASIADRTAGELHAVHVLSPAAYNHMISAEAAEAADDADLRHRIEVDLAAETLRWLRELWADTRHHSGLHAEVPHGMPADEILRLSRELPADLVVMGRYGLGRMLPAMLGSVLGSVVAGADCPVLVVNS